MNTDPNNEGAFASAEEWAEIARDAAGKAVIAADAGCCPRAEVLLRIAEHAGEMERSLRALSVPPKAPPFVPPPATR